jgi:hypothetical protein
LRRSLSKKSFLNIIALSAILAVIVPFWDAGQCLVKNYSYHEPHHGLLASSQDVILEADTDMDPEDSRDQLDPRIFDTAGFSSLAELCPVTSSGIPINPILSRAPRAFGHSVLVRQNRIGLPPPHFELG